MNTVFVHLPKEQFKFSAGHMTAFPDGSKEALHGHNFHVGLKIELASSKFQDMVPFAAFKNLLRLLVGEWHEKTLIAEKCPYFSREVAPRESIQFSMCGRKYLLPKEEVLLLPIANSSSECLAELLLSKFVADLAPNVRQKVKAIWLSLDEAPGQGASVEWRNE